MLYEADERLEPNETNLTLPTSVRSRHVLIVGKTGSGKTTKVLLPMIAADLSDMKRSIVVLDAKGDLTSGVVEMTRQIRGPDANIVYLDFTNSLATGWNPIGGEFSRTDVRDIADCLASVVKQGEGETDHFKNEAVAMLSSIIWSLRSDPARCTLAFVAFLLNQDLGEVLRQMKELGAARAAGIIGMAGGSNHNAETSVSTIRNYLDTFCLDPDVMATTSTNEFEFDQLLDRPTVLILRAPEGLDRLKPIHTVFCQRLFAHCIDAADRTQDKALPRPVSAFLDEFASALGPIPSIERVLNTFRSRGFSFTAAIQSLPQLEIVYGPAKARVIYDAFNSLIIVPPISLSDAREASERSGLVRVTKFEGAGDMDGRITREFNEVRPCLTVDEIAMPVAHPQLGVPVTFLVPSATFQAFLTPIYERPDYSHWDTRTGKPFVAHQPPLRTEPLVAPSFSNEAVRMGGFTDVRGWTDDQIRAKVEQVKSKLDWANTSGSARKWWEAFELENQHRLGLVLRLCEELEVRQASITEFFLAYVYSDVENIEANLKYLDYSRLKKKEKSQKHAGPRRAEE